LANPAGILPFMGKVASKGEIAYARFADKTPHIVLSKTSGRVACGVRDVEDAIHDAGARLRCLA